MTLNGGPYSIALKNKKSSMVINMPLFDGFISKWPRKLYDIEKESRSLGEFKAILKNRPGIYILHADNDVHYVGKAGKPNDKTGCLYSRIRDHSLIKSDHYHQGWNYFSAFIINEEHRSMIDELERMLQHSCLNSSNRSRPMPARKIDLPDSVIEILEADLDSVR